jgi:hypothetical protein
MTTQQRLVIFAYWYCRRNYRYTLTHVVNNYSKRFTKHKSLCGEIIPHKLAKKHITYKSYTADKTRLCKRCDKWARSGKLNWFPLELYLNSLTESKVQENT